MSKRPEVRRATISACMSKGRGSLLVKTAYNVMLRLTAISRIAEEMRYQEARLPVILVSRRAKNAAAN
ncbi:hypothetical protein J7K50_09955 [bacterium]|nr:hypothetical protein [bacterium]